MSYLLNLAGERRPNSRRGIYSVCSAHPWVLEAAMRRHAGAPGPLLIEATCNQVNQFGGYTSLKPGDFRDLLHQIAAGVGLPADRILLGGDHLGPFPWQSLDAETAMTNACEMVTLFVREGYTKIHLDASMPCADDSRPLPEEIIAERAARLCRAAESAAANSLPVYVVGTEVPTPGGAAEDMEMPVTSTEDAERALQLHRAAFASAGLESAWERVIALVVQPGVEFGNESVEDYVRGRARELSAMLERNPGLIFEAHSTDYQRPDALAALVEDGFAILKVGPGLTYAMRQALYALARIEEELIPADRQSHLRDRLEQAMLANPEQWSKHYHGTPAQQRRLRVHSYSDRIRYYWMEDTAKKAVSHLMENLQSITIPETLLSDYLPAQYTKVRAGEMRNDPLSVVMDAVGAALDPYIAACSE